MKTAPIVRVVLLVLVVASIGAWAFKTWSSTAAAPAAGADASLPADGVAVINFHGKLRCPTCLSIGAMSQSVVAEEFADAAREGRVTWLSVDFDQPANEHFKDDYDLVSSNVVVVRREGGVDAGWERLDDVWTHYADEPAFRAYVHGAVAGALEAH